MSDRRFRFPRALACALSPALAICCLPASALAWTDDGDSVLERGAAELGLPDDLHPSIEAYHAALMDEDGTLWFGRAAGERAQKACITKIMTAFVASEHLYA